MLGAGGGIQGHARSPPVSRCGHRLILSFEQKNLGGITDRLANKFHGQTQVCQTQV
jgi:hypothetical protein